MSAALPPRIVRLASLLPFITVAVVCGFLSAAAPTPPSATAPSAARSAAPSGPAKDFLARQVDKSAFARGLALVKNHSESAASRNMVLGKLLGSRKAMDVGQLRSLRDEARALARDSQEEPALSAQAVGALASVNMELLERGAISPAEAKLDAPLLLNVAQDGGKDRELRGRAIRALSDLRVADAAPVLQRILADPANHNLPEVARNGCLALGRLAPPEQAQPAIVNVMRQTAERSVFGSGALALGRLKTAEAMAALVELEARFPDSDSCAAALSEMEEVILGALESPQHPQLVQAIQATRHLWKRNQRERYGPLLRQLLKSAPEPARARALERLIENAGELEFTQESRELEALLGMIADQPGLAGYAERIRRRLAARPLAPTGKTIPVPSGANQD